MPAHQAEKLFSTEYFEHEFPKSIRLGCDSYHLPAHVTEHVDFIKPGVAFSSPMKKRNVKRSETTYRWPKPPHGAPHPKPHWQPPPGSQNIAPDLRTCSANIT